MIPFCLRTISLRLLTFCITSAILASVGASARAEVRDKAVVGLTFDDLPTSGTATATADTAKAGKVLDTVSLTQGPSRVPSAFVAGSTGASLILDPAKKQQIVIANSEDISRPDAVS
ncbi:MAG TPA: hypothetical protein PK992_00780, partial [Planctomycetaceae bacterium]|nr:hypothetical protein [Planctomycetaceae bacterium]